MLPNNGKICEEKIPPWQQAENGHRIFCHIPIETLATFDPIISAPE
jgi:peptide/nickel transport system ATP-binding protein